MVCTRALALWKGRRPTGIEGGAVNFQFLDRFTEMSRAKRLTIIGFGCCIALLAGKAERGGRLAFLKNAFRQFPERRAFIRVVESVLELVHDVVELKGFNQVGAVFPHDRQEGLAIFPVMDPVIGGEAPAEPDF